MNVMTSCSLRPASRARKPPMAWMPSCELPAMRMTASETFEMGELPPEVVAVKVDSLMECALNVQAWPSQLSAQDVSSKL